MKAESENILIELLDEGTTETRKALLLQQLADDKEALESYNVIRGSENFIQTLPLESPSPSFNEGVLLGYKRIKTRQANNRLVTYFVGVMAAIVALLFSFAGDSTASLPSASTPMLEQISQRLPNLAIPLNPDSLLQLVLVLNAGLIIVLIEKIVSKKKVLGIHSFM